MKYVSFVFFVVGVIFSVHLFIQLQFVSVERVFTDALVIAVSFLGSIAARLQQDPFDSKEKEGELKETEQFDSRAT